MLFPRMSDPEHNAEDYLPYQANRRKQKKTSVRITGKIIAASKVAIPLLVYFLNSLFLIIFHARHLTYLLSVA